MVVLLILLIQSAGNDLSYAAKCLKFHGNRPAIS